MNHSLQTILPSLLNRKEFPIYKLQEGKVTSVNHLVTLSFEEIRKNELKAITNAVSQMNSYLTILFSTTWNSLFKDSLDLGKSILFSLYQKPLPVKIFSDVAILYKKTIQWYSFIEKTFQANGSDNNHLLELIKLVCNLTVDFEQKVIAFSQLQHLDLKSQEVNVHDIKLEIDRSTALLQQMGELKDDNSFISNRITLEFLDSSGTKQEKMFFPPLLLDIVRSLIANSRKYSHPLSNIIVEVKSMGENLILSIVDEWYWISENEIENIFSATWFENIKYKYGINLAKSLYFTKLLGWELYIKTKENYWTIITIFIPLNWSLKKKEPN